MEECLIKLTGNNRIQVTELKTCNNKLPVVTGRYQGIMREDKIYNKCDTGVLEDEYYVIFQCNN